jgi:hypothetical protein
MFYEGALRLLAGGMSVVPCMPTVGDRVALETYPGSLARRVTRVSYKKGGRERSTSN